MVEIDDGVNDEQNQVIAEDQAEGVGQWRVIGEEGRDLGIVGEEYVVGEDVGDVLHRIEARDQEVLRYPPVLGYDDPYVPNVQE